MKRQLEEVKGQSKKEQSAVEPLRREMDKLTRENNELHLELIKVNLVDAGETRLQEGIETTNQDIETIDAPVQRKGRPGDLAFRSMPAHSQTRYAASLEKESMIGVPATFGEVAKNENPADNKRNLRDSLTFAQMFGRYHAEHCFPHKKTAKEDQTKFDKYLSNRDHGINLAKIKLCELTKADVRKLFDGIGKDHPITANRVLALVSSIMSDAIRDGFYEKINPCKGIKRFKENQRKRFIHPEEFPVFVKALEACTSDVTRDYIWMSLFTGARRSNVLQMKWEDVHLLRRVWRIPDTKNGESQDVPLVEQAVEILRRRFESKTGKYVFPGTGKAGYLTEPKKAWKTIITKAGMSDLRIHDLRRTFGAYQAGTGANLAVIATSLNHKSLKTTQVYARLWPNAVRSAANTAINEMFSAIRGESANDEILEVQALE